MSGEPVSVEHREGFALLIIDNPPVNAASHAVREGLLRALEALDADDGVEGVLLACAGRTFVAGADVAEFGRPAAAPALRDVCDAFDAVRKPVVAVLHGTALGGGLELALACHYRVADPAGKVGLPEVTLGLVPGAGGTQRLPRLIGTGPALDIILSGRRVGAEEALRLGLVDAVAAGDRLAFAVDFLRDRLESAVPRLRERPFPPVTAADAEGAQAILRKARGQTAAGRALRLMEVSTGLDFGAGMALERETFEELRNSAEAKALRHIFFAERAAGKSPTSVAGRVVKRVGVVGGGTMGAGIAAACILAGLEVRLVERDATALEAGRQRIGAILDDAAKRGKLSEAKPVEANQLAATTDMAALGDADLVVEAVFESLDVKCELFRALDAVARPGAVLATNTSYLDVAAIAGATSRPGDVIGLHFFSLAHVMKLVEVVVPDGASPDAVATGFGFVRRIGKLAVRTGNREGFIGNRILSAYRRAVEHMVEDGASPFEIDRAFRAFGFPMGVFEMQDLAGLDIGWATRKRLASTRDPAERYSRVSDRICERGWFGRKSGRGYYLYSEGERVPNPEVEAIVAAERRDKGIAPRVFTMADIQHRVLLAMVNEGARILEEAVARQAGDIDVVMVNGYGFPRWRGGPMHAAEALGFGEVLNGIEALAGEDPLWRPAPLLRRLVDAGENAFSPGS